MPVITSETKHANNSTGHQPITCQTNNSLVHNLQKLKRKCTSCPTAHICINVSITLLIRLRVCFVYAVQQIREIIWSLNKNNRALNNKRQTTHTSTVAKPPHPPSRTSANELRLMECFLQLLNCQTRLQVNNYHNK